MASLGAPLAFPLGGDTAPSVTPVPTGTTPVPVALRRTLLLDEDGDVDLASGNLAFASGVEAIRVSVYNRLQVFQGEWYLDLDEGMPYFQTILVKSPDTALVRAAFRERILATPGVTAIDSLALTLDPSTRELTVEYVAQTDAGLLSDTVEAGVV